MMKAVVSTSLGMAAALLLSAPAASQIGPNSGVGARSPMAVPNTGVGTPSPMAVPGTGIGTPSAMPGTPAVPGTPRVPGAPSGPGTMGTTNDPLPGGGITLPPDGPADAPGAGSDMNGEPTDPARRPDVTRPGDLTPAPGGTGARDPYNSGSTTGSVEVPSPDGR